MKRVILVIAILFMLSGISYSAPVTLGGYSYTPVTKTDAGAGAETDTVVWTPASGLKIVLMGVAFSADATTQFLVESGSTLVIPNNYHTASGLRVIGTGSPIWKGAADATLTYSTTGVGTHSILMWGYETGK